MFLHDWKDKRKEYYQIINSFYSLEQTFWCWSAMRRRMKDSDLIGHEVVGLALYRNNRTDVSIDFPKWW